MTKTTSYKEPYFSHDIATRGDEKILKMFFSFRKQAKTMQKAELEQFAPVGAYGIFWSVVEYMHRNEMKVEDIEIIADDLRIDVSYVKQIMDNFNLFYKENGCYVSDRIIENINQQEEKSKKAKTAAESRWLLSDFCSEYEKVFGIKPELEDKEIDKLKLINKKVKNLKSKLPAVLSILSKIKFDTASGFIPRVNWLLSGNNFYQIINGQYGELKIELTEKEKLQLKKQQKDYEDKIANFDIDSFDSKIQAMDFIVRGNSERSICDCHRQLMAKFDITKAELSQYWGEINNVQT